MDKENITQVYNFETFTITMNLRYNKIDRFGFSNEPVLQQLYMGSKGTERWDDIVIGNFDAK